ncbi:E3 ubiquitin ligase PQT3-like isoform X2 [Quercus suber]|uniref:E3 ubiquitin ligase PQT3-like isoform X2 n=1 Tax=Quercus suber TaxID=58331 RepID=UPI0032DEA50A
MAVYYKFKSAKDYDSIPMDGPFLSVGTLKEKIFESKHLGRGTDFDLVVTNAQTNEEYLDEAMLIPKNTSVLIRRVPGRPRMTIVTEQEPKVESKMDDPEPEKSSFPVSNASTMKYPEDSEWDEFGNDLYAIPEVLPVQSNNPVPEALPTNKADEDSKIKALIDTPALDWQRQGPDGFAHGRGFGRGGMGGRMGGRGFGFERKTPPQGYVCHRCKVPGHFIQHCPTNGDPNFDIKKVKPPTGIPKSMLMATPDGSYALPSGAVAVLRPNEAAFEREIEGLPSARSVGELPPELHCPLCKDVMKDAVLTSKCCFQSFCDRCIRDHIISKSMCICGATNILADDLLPNKTLRDTINRILEAGNSSAENAGSTFQVQDMESARCPQPKIPSPTLSAASKGEQKRSTINEETPKIQDTAAEGKAAAILPQQTAERARTAKTADISEATHESMSVKEPAASQGSAPLAEEEVQQRVAVSDAGNVFFNGIFFSLIHFFFVHS